MDQLIKWIKDKPKESIPTIIAIIAVLLNMIQLYISNRSLNEQKKQNRSLIESSWEIKIIKGENSDEDQMEIRSSNGNYLFQNAEIIVYEEITPKIIPIYSSISRIQPLKKIIQSIVSEHYKRSPYFYYTDIGHEIYPIAIRIKAIYLNDIVENTFIYKLHFNGYIGYLETTINILNFEYVSQCKNDQSHIQQVLLSLNLSNGLLSHSNQHSIEIKDKLLRKDSSYTNLMEIIDENHMFIAQRRRFISEGSYSNIGEITIMYPSYFENDSTFQRHAHKWQTSNNKIGFYPLEVRQRMTELSDYEAGFYEYFKSLKKIEYTQKDIVKFKGAVLTERNIKILKRKSNTLYKLLINQIKI